MKDSGSEWNHYLTWRQKTPVRMVYNSWIQMPLGLSCTLYSIVAQSKLSVPSLLETIWMYFYQLHSRRLVINVSVTCSHWITLFYEILSLACSGLSFSLAGYHELWIRLSWNHLKVNRRVFWKACETWKLNCKFKCKFKLKLLFQKFLKHIFRHSTTYIFHEFLNMLCIFLWCSVIDS